MISFFISILWFLYRCARGQSVVLEETFGKDS